MFFFLGRRFELRTLNLQSRAGATGYNWYTSIRSVGVFFLNLNFNFSRSIRVAMNAKEMKLRKKMKKK